MPGVNQSAASQPIHARAQWPRAAVRTAAKVDFFFVAGAAAVARAPATAGGTDSAEKKDS